MATSWTIDECPDANGFATIRPSDGTPNGDTETQPIATVYDDAHVSIIAAAPVMLKALQNLVQGAFASTYDLDDPVQVEAMKIGLAAITEATRKA